MQGKVWQESAASENDSFLSCGWITFMPWITVPYKNIQMNVCYIYTLLSWSTPPASLYIIDVLFFIPAVLKPAKQKLLLKNIKVVIGLNNKKNLSLNTIFFQVHPQ